MWTTIIIIILVCAGLVGLAGYICARKAKTHKDIIMEITEEAVRLYFDGHSVDEAFALAKKLYGWKEGANRAGTT